MANCTPAIKGEKELILTPEDFLDKVAQLISRRGKHRHRYHGVLAPNHPMRSQVVSYACKPLPSPLGKVEKLKRRVKEFGASVKVKYLWAILIARIYEVMPLLCLNCGREMRIIAFIKERSAITQILDHIYVSYQRRRHYRQREVHQLMTQMSKWICSMNQLMPSPMMRWIKQ